MNHCTLSPLISTIYGEDMYNPVSSRNQIRLVFLIVKVLIIFGSLTPLTSPLEYSPYYLFQKAYMNIE